MNKRSLFIYLVIGATALLVLVTAFNRRFLSPRAAAGTPEFTVSAEPATLIKGENGALIISVNPNGKSFNTFALEATYSANDLAPQGATLEESVEWLYAGQFQVAKATITEEPNGVRRVRLEAALLQNSIGGATAVPLLKIKVRTLNPSATTTTIAWNMQALALYNGSQSVPVSAVNGVIPLSSGGSGISDPTTASLSITTNKTTYTPGETVELKVHILSGTPPATGTLSNFASTDVFINYTDGSIAPHVVNNKLRVESPFSTEDIIATVNEQEKLISLAIPFLDDAGQKKAIDKSQPIATIYFTPKQGVDQNGKTESFTIATSSKVYLDSRQNVYTRSLEGTNTTQTVSFASSTVTPDPSTPELTFTIRLQGIAAGGTPPTTTTLPVVLTAAGGGLEEPKSFTTQITWQAEGGVWQGTQSLTGVPFSDKPYSFYLKGPKHLRKRICALNTPQTSGADDDARCNSPLIVLSNPTTTADWSEIRLLVGDLPPQNGVLNPADAFIMRNSLLSQDPDAIGKADLNYDGVVNANDTSLFLESMQRKYDEDIIE